MRAEQNNQKEPTHPNHAGEVNTEAKPPQYLNQDSTNRASRSNRLRIQQIKPIVDNGDFAHQTPATEDHEPIGMFRQIEQLLVVSGVADHTSQRVQEWLPWPVKLTYSAES
jgi:hypothetical protein